MKKAVNVYEVVRIINKKPLFLAEHYQRFVSSLKHFKLCPISLQYFIDEICKAIEIERISNGNIRIDTFIDSKTQKCEIHIKEIPHHYPTPDQYGEGVKTLTYSHVRPNPQKKIWYAELRNEIDAIIKKENCYEVLYYNDDNCLTEGSRSNLFFIKDNKLYTPLNKQVLHGITRQNIIKLAQEMDIEVIETNIPLSDLSLFDSAFISGTSPNILPVKMIDDFKLDIENPTLRRLIEHFYELIQSDLEKFKGCIE